jgi:hypothetical protein
MFLDRANINFVEINITIDYFSEWSNKFSISRIIFPSLKKYENKFKTSFYFEFEQKLKKFMPKLKNENN